jgi:hypothetical protein
VKQEVLMVPRIVRTLPISQAATDTVEYTIFIASFFVVGVCIRARAGFTPLRLGVETFFAEDSFVIQTSPQEFLEACGARSPLVLEIERYGPSEKVRHTLSLPFALIGHDERADLRLDDEQVSSRHAYLQVAAGRLWCVMSYRRGLQYQPPSLKGRSKRYPPLPTGAPRPATKARRRKQRSDSWTAAFVVWLREQTLVP